jgi:hypothetical protein
VDYTRAVAGGECLAVELHRAASEVNVGITLRWYVELRRFGAVEQSGVDARVLVHAEDAVTALRRDDQAQAAALFGIDHVDLLITRRDSETVRHNPNLKKMHQRVRVGIELAVFDTAPGTHHLHVAGANHRTGSHRVAMRQCAVEHVGENFHVAMRVCAKPLSRLDAIVVYYQQVRKSDLFWIAVMTKRKTVPRVQPAELGDATVFCSANGNHVYFYSVSRGPNKRTLSDRSCYPGDAI